MLNDVISEVDIKGYSIIESTCHVFGFLANGAILSQPVGFILMLFFLEM